VWPLERRRGVLRLGRAQAEFWVPTAAGLVLSGRLPLAAEPEAAAALEGELRPWLQAVAESPSRRNSIDIVVESAWLPVMMVSMGDALWSQARIEALLRHRFTELYAQPGAPADGWQLMLDYRPGEAQALGFGLAPLVRQAVLGAVAEAGWRAASLQPALAWGRQRLRRLGRGPRSGWFTWIEQDRALVCRLERGRMTAMNAAAAVPSDEAECARLVACEAIRLGVPEAGSAMLMASWQDLAAPAAASALSASTLNPQATT
jgi:hypothetical protein